MPGNNLSPLSVVPYGKDYLVDFVRYKTGWDQRSEVSDKIQLNYLCKYLEVDHINAKTIVVEDEYIDRHYLEDYSEYYARCFPRHPRTCSRLHFFNTEFDEHAFVTALTTNDRDFIASLSKSYIGFVVIRPIPHTFLAKLCLKPYDDLLNKHDYEVIVKPNEVSLFGVPLEVRTAPFLEQDKVVSACATSALWTLLSASPHISPENQPSPSAITKSATQSFVEGTRTFPTSGLTPLQVARSLKCFGLEPSIQACDTSAVCLDSLKEILHGYITNNIPVLVGGDIYRMSDDGATGVYLGKHLVCALGYWAAPMEESPRAVDMSLRSHQMEKIYVHDDRYGPFVKIDLSSREFGVNGDPSVMHEGLALSLHGEREDVFIPDIIIVGLYHKVRITYSYVRNVCHALYGYLKKSADISRRGIAVSSDLPEDAKRYFEKTITSLGNAVHGVWDISLTTNTKIKKELLGNDAYHTFNGSASKTTVLLQSMPRYIWRCRVFKLKGGSNSVLTDILFDATEVPQGRIVIGYISYSESAENLWKYVERQIADRAWESYEWNDSEVTEKQKKHIGPFVRFFGEEKDKTYLNSMYGPLGLPRRSLKFGEFDSNYNISNRKDVFIVRRGSSEWDWNRLDAATKYIWVINEAGDIVIGEDIVTEDQEYQGHPTLVDGKPARIGGELKYDESTERWLVNLRSGAYSGHLKRGSEASKTYLANVIAHNLAELKVQPED